MGVCYSNIWVYPDFFLGTIFDSSAIKLPDSMGSSLTTHTGKFTCEVSPDEKNKKPPSQLIG